MESHRISPVSSLPWTCRFNRANWSCHVQQFHALFCCYIYILASPLLCHEKRDDAQNYLELFVGHCSDLYEPTSIVYNVHALVHLVQDVKVYGCLDKFSAFPFESFLGMLKKLVRKPSQPLQQVIKRLKERSKFYSKAQSSSLCIGEVRKEHTRGPLVPGHTFQLCTQYGEIQLKIFVFTRFKGDNCVRIHPVAVRIYSSVLLELCMLCIRYLKRKKTFSVIHWNQMS